MTTRRLTIPLLVLALVPAACGHSNAPATSTAIRPTAKQKGAVPEELIGTWKTKLRATDLPRTVHVANPFRVTVSPTGGVNGAPSFTLANSEEALEGETSTPIAAGHTITLEHEGCLVEGSGYRFYDNVYRYAISGNRLTFTVVKNACKDRVAESILTSRPFTRSQ